MSRSTAYGVWWPYLLQTAFLTVKRNWYISDNRHRVGPTVNSTNNNNLYGVVVYSVLIVNTNPLFFCLWRVHLYSKLCSYRQSSSFDVFIPLTASLRLSTPRVRIDKKSYTMSAAAMADISASIVGLSKRLNCRKGATHHWYHKQAKVPQCPRLRYWVHSVSVGSYEALEKSIHRTRACQLCHINTAVVRDVSDAY